MLRELFYKVCGLKSYIPWNTHLCWTLIIVTTPAMIRPNSVDVSARISRRIAANKAVVLPHLKGRQLLNTVMINLTNIMLDRTQTTGRLQSRSSEISWLRLGWHFEKYTTILCHWLRCESLVVSDLNLTYRMLDCPVQNISSAVSLDFSWHCDVFIWYFV